MIRVTEITNRMRARWAEQTIEAYTKITGKDGFINEQEKVVDMMTDLLHYCGQTGIKFDRVLEQCKEHYRIENL